ncbi:MAG: hypothetical protein K2M03_07250, partial [Muribaculaceae bacterium]|nr:hypothetical protein [Muribaculaceae bacterium]
WSIAAVLKTVEGHTSGGSNPSLSANHTKPAEKTAGYFFTISFLICSVCLRVRSRFREQGDKKRDARRASLFLSGAHSECGSFSGFRLY